ncbi:MAG: hypothetical protein DRJ43_06280 [Thermoprotei archaeon]|nr:MAG: hypothetical protein DRJ43_06280 [Thermoprotei archaeon]
MAARALLGIASAALLGLGALFLIASLARFERILVGAPLLVCGFILAYRLLKPRPQVLEVKVSWDPSGKLAVEELKCPYCGASLPAPEPGQEYIKCKYCGRTVKLVEEPIW